MPDPLRFVHRLYPHEPSSRGSAMRNGDAGNLADQRLPGRANQEGLSVAGDRRRPAHPAHDLSQADEDCRQRHPRAATTGSTKPSSLIIHAAGPAADQAFHIPGSVQYNAITARMMAAGTMTKPTHDQQPGRCGARHQGRSRFARREVRHMRQAGPAARAWLEIFGRLIGEPSAKASCPGARSLRVSNMVVAEHLAAGDRLRNGSGFAVRVCH